MSAGAPSRQAARARAALLRAARQVFEAKGYANARVEDVTEAAQYAVGSFYTYFDSKEDAFREVMRQLGTDVDERARTGRTVGRRAGQGLDVAGLERRVQHANQRYHRAFTAEGRLWAVVEEAALRHPGPRAMIRDRWRRYWDATATALEPWRERGVIAPDVDVLATVTGLSAMTEWVISLRRVYGFTFTRPVAVPELAPVWARVLGAGPGDPGPALAVPSTPAPPPIKDEGDGEGEGDREATTRGRLLAAGRAELSARGVGDVPISDIAATAGVSVGSFYKYFPSKPDLLAAVLAESPGLLYAPPGGDEDERPDLAGGALALNRAHLASVAANEGLWRTVVEAALTEPLVRAVVNEQRHAWMRLLAALVARWQAAGLADPGLDPDLAGTCLGALTERTAHLWVLLGDAPPTDVGAARLQACWWRLLAPRA